MQNDDFGHFWTTWFGGGLIDRFMGPILTQNVHFEQNLQLLFRGQRVPNTKMWYFAKARTPFWRLGVTSKVEKWVLNKKSKCAKIDVFGVFQKPHFFTFCSFLAQSFKNVMVAKNDPYLQNDQKCHFGVWPKIDFGLQGDSSHLSLKKLVSKRVLSFDILIYALLPKSPLFSVHLTTTFWGLLAVLKRGINTKGRFSCF